MSQIEAVLLAAGESRRMRFPKALIRIGDETFLGRLTRIMLTVSDRVVVVLGAHADRIRAAVPADARITTVENQDWQRGQLSSMKVGLRAVSAGAQAVLVHLVDHPTVKPETFAALVTAHRETGKAIVVARFDGRRGHPVVFSRSVFEELLNAAEDQGARVVVSADPSRVHYLDVDDCGVTLDLDTPEDLHRAGFLLPNAT